MMRFLFGIRELSPLYIEEGIHTLNPEQNCNRRKIEIRYGGDKVIAEGG